MVGIQTSHNFSVNEEFRKQVSVLSNTPEALAKRKQLGRKLGEVRLRRIRNMELAGLITQNMVMQRLKKNYLLTT